jgi:site-specific recombinase XerD
MEDKMETRVVNQWTIIEDDNLSRWVEGFLIDRKVQNLSRGTLEFYRWKLKDFITFCDARTIINISQITPSLLREFLLDLENKGHNPGGIHAGYRTVKVFLRWWENETEPKDWTNPIRKVKSPRVPEELLEPVDIKVVYEMMAAYSGEIVHRFRSMPSTQSGLMASSKWGEATLVK